MTNGKDPFLNLVKKQKTDKTQTFKDALLFAKSEAHTDSGRRFVASCQKWFDEKGFLTEKQVQGLYRVDSAPPYQGSAYADEEYFEHMGEWPDDTDFDPFDP